MNDSIIDNQIINADINIEQHPQQFSHLGEYSDDPYQKHRSLTYRSQKNRSMSYKSLKLMNQVGSSLPQNKSTFQEDKSSGFIGEDDSSQNRQIITKFEELIFKIKMKFFARRLINSTRSRMFTNLTSRQFKLIGDVSCDEQLILQKQNQLINNKKVLLNKKMRSSTLSGSFLKDQEMQFPQKIAKWVFNSIQISNFLEYLDKTIPIFNPSSLFKVIWDLMSIILLSCYFFLIPFQMSFYIYRDDIFFLSLIISVPFFTFFDCLLKLNTSYYDKGKMITKRYHIIQNYFRTFFLSDMLIILSYSIYLNQVSKENSSRYLDFLLLNLVWKVKQFTSTFNKLEEYTIFTKRQKNVIALFKLIFTILIIAHILSCLWIIVAEIGVSNGKRTWFKTRSIENSDWYSIYIDSYYFTTVTMVTVGYGDILPISEEEKAACIIFMIFSCGIFAYSMNTIGAILLSFNEHQVVLQQNMAVINSYMKRKNVSKQTQSSIREYLEYYWKEENERNQEQEDKILQILSENLRDNLLIEGKGVVLKQSPIFRDNFSDQVKQKIVPLIKEIRYTPEEIICSQGEIDDCSIYFIEKGSVNILVDHEYSTQSIYSQGTKQIQTLKTGQSFGELSFFTGQSRNMTVKSKEFTTILLIKRQDFLDILKNLEEDYEQFCNIKDNIHIYSDFQLIYVQCPSCKSLKHQINECPYLHFIPNYAKLREQFMSCPQQERKNHFRKQQFKKCCLTSQKDNYFDAVKIQEEDTEMQEYINAYIQYQNIDNFSSDLEDLSPQVPHTNDDSLVFDKLNQFHSRQNNQDDAQKNETSIYQSTNRSIHTLADVQNKVLFSEIQNNMYHTSENESAFSPRKKNKVTTLNRIKTDYPQKKKEDEVEYIPAVQKSKLVSTSSEKIASSFGELKKSFHENYVQSSTKQTYEDKYFNDLMEKPVSTQPYIQTQPSQLGAVHQRSLVFQQQQKNLETINQTQQKYQVFFNRILKILLENVSLVQKEQQPMHQSDSPSIKKHVSNTYATNPTVDQLQRMYNPLLEKKSSFIVVKNNFSNSINNQIETSVNQFSKQISAQIGNNIASITTPRIQLSFKDSQTNKAQYYETQNNIDKYKEEELLFDIMKNFTLYFPLNNFSHQLKLMSLTQEQKRQKMLRNHIENLNFIKRNKSHQQHRKTRIKTLADSYSIINRNSNKQNFDDDIIESQYTKKKARFHVNQFERSSILEKFESFSQVMAKNKSQNHQNSYNIQELTNKSIKSAYCKQQNEIQLINRDDFENSVYIPSNTNLHKSFKSRNDQQINDDDQRRLSFIKKVEKKASKFRDFDSDSSSSNTQIGYPFKQTDLSSQQIGNVIILDANKLQSDLTKSQIEGQQISPLLDSLKIDQVDCENISSKSKKKYSDNEYDIQTEFSQKKKSIKILHPSMKVKKPEN